MLSAMYLPKRFAHLRRSINLGLIENIITECTIEVGCEIDVFIAETQVQTYHQIDMGYRSMFYHFHLELRHDSNP